LNARQFLALHTVIPSLAVQEPCTNILPKAVKRLENHVEEKLVKIEGCSFLGNVWLVGVAGRCSWKVWLKGVAGWCG
jgi:hypothetical protein